MSLSIAFAMALVLSYFVGQSIHQQIQLGKLTSTDQATFERGVGYVVTKAGTSELVTAEALEAVQTIDPQRAADLLLAVAQSHAGRTDVKDPPIPDAVNDAVAPLMKRMSAKQAIGLYDGLVQVAGIDAIRVSEDLLNSLEPKDDAQLLQVVDLLDTRLLWSRRWVPLDLWVRWLGVLAESESELTQFNTVKRLGELPEAVDEPDVAAALSRLAKSKFDTVRNIVLKVVAGYAAIAKDPTDYEQLIFSFGNDENKTIARRAWMIVGHLKPLSGFAVNWKDADPTVAEAMLWAAVKTNPQLTTPAWAALDDESAEANGIIALSTAGDQDTIDRMEVALLQRRAEIQVWRLLCALSVDDRPRTDIRDLARHQFSWNEEDQDPFGVSVVWGWKEHPGLKLAAEYYAYPRATDRELAPALDAMRRLANLEGLARLPKNEHEQYRYFGREQPATLRLIGAAAGFDTIDHERLIGELPLNEPVLLDLFTLILADADNDVIDRFIRSSHPEMVTMAAMASAIKGYTPRLIQGVNAAFLLKHPDLDIESLRAMSDDELSELGLKRIDALPALLEAAEAAPPSANRATEAKLLKLAMWMRGDFDEDFTATAEAMLFDDEVPTSAVLMALLHMKRPAALDYLFGDLATPRPDLNQLFIQQRYWHVFRRFVDTTDLTLWFWGDPEAQAFQLEAMRQWYAVNRWKIQKGWWPEPITE